MSYTVECAQYAYCACANISFIYLFVDLILVFKTKRKIEKNKQTNGTYREENILKFG